MVYRTKKVYRTYFRELPFGTDYWLATATLASTAPSIKLGRKTYLGGWTPATGAPTATSQADSSAAVIKVPQVFIGQRTMR